MKKLLTRIRVKQAIRQHEAHLNSRKELLHEGLENATYKLRHINRLKKLIK